MTSISYSQLFDRLAISLLRAANPDLRRCYAVHLHFVTFDILEAQVAQVAGAVPSCTFELATDMGKERTEKLMSGLDVLDDQVVDVAPMLDSEDVLLFQPYNRLSLEESVRLSRLHLAVFTQRSQLLVASSSPSMYNVLPLG